MLIRSAITLVVALPVSNLLTACSGADANAAKRPASPTSTTASERAPLSDPSDPAWQSPLESALGGSDEVIDLILRGQAQNAERRAECMSQRGFDDPQLPRSRASLTLDYFIARYGATVADPSYRTRWGYGIATRFRPDGTQYRNEGALYIDEEPQGLPAPAQRSPSQEVAYQKALTGFDPSSPPPASKEEAAKIAAHGCAGIADRATAEDYPAYASVIDFLSSIDASSTSVTAASTRWMKCMGDLGYSVADRFNPATDLAGEVDRLSNSGTIDPVRLVALQDRELTMANHDWECRLSSGLTTELNRSLDRLELKFVNRASDLLDELQQQGP